MDPEVERALRKLRELFARERASHREHARKEREGLDLTTRVKRGIALKGLVAEDTDALAGGRILLWARLREGMALEDLRIGTGDPVLLWSGDPEKPDGVRAQAVVARMRPGQIGLALEASAQDVLAALEAAPFNLDREAPEVSFDRGDQAITRALAAKVGSDAARLRDVLYGACEAESVSAAEAVRLRAESTLDAGLDDTQRRAVLHALCARDLALVLGPPGTGKTRTLTEIVRRTLAQGKRVLVTAASNTAVDNLAERLLSHGVRLVRLGHPARVSPAIEARTLDALIDESGTRKHTRKLLAEAAELRRRVQKRRARGALDFREAREQERAARALISEARAMVTAERESVLERAEVLCATLAGLDDARLAGKTFGLVVIDEASQALDPMTLGALGLGEKLVLAGDPEQLPPTVLDPEVARDGLGRTLFERVAQARPALVSMLKVQYRMHEALMRFPSERSYGGELRAAERVASHTLEDLGARADAARPSPLCFIDSAGKGWDEARDADDPSTCNPQQAERTAMEVLRLRERGLSPSHIAVITPYLAQARGLRERLRPLLQEGLEIGTVDGFQGREKEAIVLDLVRSNADHALGFLTDTRRMNVALTRAKRFLVVIGDSATLAEHGYYKALLAHVESTGAYLSAWEVDG